MTGVDTVFHAAGPPEQWLPDPGVFDRVHVDGTRHVVATARQCGVRRLVLTSTIDVFDAPPGARIDESVIASHPKGTPYERAKQQADTVVVQAMRDGLDAVFVHPCAVYGPGPARSRGINDFVRDLDAGKIPALLPGGMPVVFAADVGEAHVRAAERGTCGERFIVAERYVTLRELTVAANAALGRSRVPPVVPMPVARAMSLATEAWARLTGTPPLVPAGQLQFLQWGVRPDASHARQRLDMRFTPLDQGLQALVAWLRGGESSR
jgi:dihydroflavonol-4-reductase